MCRFLVGVATALMVLSLFFMSAPAFETAQPLVKKIYCAGPLFNAKEREEMEQIAVLLEKSGFRVFLPHRDGINLADLLDSFLANGVPHSKALDILNKAIFYLDVFKVLDSDGLILNMNGRVPDEGAMVEAGIAWHAGKAIVIYSDDARSLVSGNDNPLVMGLSGFNKLSDINKIPQAFKAIFAAGTSPEKRSDLGTEGLVSKGRQILETLSTKNNSKAVARDLMQLLDR